LKRGYRDLLRACRPDVYCVHLDGDPEAFAQRLADRSSHFMPAALLDSQLATLEPLEDDERGCVVDVGRPVDEVVATAYACLPG
jgi:beta-N-acetylhexosaminidase